MNEPSRRVNLNEVILPLVVSQQTDVASDQLPEHCDSEPTDKESRNWLRLADSYLNESTILLKQLRVRCNRPNDLARRTLFIRLQHNFAFHTSRSGVHGLDALANDPNAGLMLAFAAIRPDERREITTSTSQSAPGCWSVTSAVDWTRASS